MKSIIGLRFVYKKGRCILQQKTGEFISDHTRGMHSLEESEWEDVPLYDGGENAERIVV